jgi:regulator of RNase E activity RraA
VIGVDTAIIERFRELSTASVSDALDRLRLPGSALGIAPLARGQRLAGQAFTVKYVPVGPARGTVGDYIDDVEPGRVVVLDNDGRLDCTVWGDILTAVAHARGSAGTVIHGVGRDVARALQLGYPIYRCGRFMRTGKDRVEVSGTNVAVTLGDVQVRAGDLVLGDDDGVVVVAQEEAERALEVATRIAELEDRIVAESLQGTPLREARARHGYHVLQRSEEA